jgi:hypothetical protein
MMPHENCSTPVYSAVARANAPLRFPKRFSKTTRDVSPLDPILTETSGFKFFRMNTYEK